MVVFLLLLCLSKTNAAIWLPLLTALAYYCLDSVSWDTIPFVSGIIFAEFSLIKKETSYRLEDLLLLVRVQGRGAIKVEQWFLNIFWLLLFLSGLFLGSWTVLLAKTSPELVTLNQFTPAKYNPSDLRGYFWNSIRAVLIMLAFENLR
jgi:hypothetical protein